MSENSPTPFLPTTRREFLRLSAKGAGLLAFSSFAPRFLVQSALAGTPAPESDRSILVLVQLAGGNDGLNTLVPFDDPDYYRLRPTLGIPKDKVLKVGAGQGLHPSMGALQRLVGDGKLAIVQNVGYPNPNRSHFRSTEIWETASDSDRVVASGWIGRYLDNACDGVPSDSHDPVAVHITNGVPLAFSSDHDHSTFGLLPGRYNFRENEQTRKLLEELASTPDTAASGGSTSFLEHTYMDTLVTEKKVQRVIDAYRPAARYPANPLAASLRNVAALIASAMPTRVYFVSLTGFDTHANQLPQQARLLGELSDSLAAFQKDLEIHKLEGQVVTMTFSEFGRRPSENDSHGTDHGTAAPLFIMGTRIRGGLHGTAPSLKVERNHDLTFSTDFRQVYATMLDGWLGSSSRPVLGAEFERMAILS